MKIRIFYKFSWIMKDFLFMKPILIKIKGKLMFFWKSLIFQKDIEKPSGKRLRLSGKNQWRLKFVRKILNFDTKISIRICFFNQFSIRCSRNFVILYRSGKKHHFYSTFFRFQGGVLALDNAIEISSCKYVAHQTVAWKPQSLVHSSIRVLHV